MEKKCIACKRSKPLEEFWVERRRKAGRVGRCKTCLSETRRGRHAVDPRGVLLGHARRRANEQSLPFSITTRDIPVPNYCPALGIPIRVIGRTLHDGSPTIDRIIPERGYVPGNVVVISHLANRIKNSADAAQLRLMAAWLSSHTE